MSIPEYAIKSRPVVLLFLRYFSDSIGSLSKLRTVDPDKLRTLLWTFDNPRGRPLSFHSADNA